MDIGGIDENGINIGGMNVGGIKVGEVGIYGIGVYEAEVYIVLKKPSFLFFSTPSIAFFLCFSSSFRVFYFKVRFAVFSSSRRFVALLYFFLFIKSLPFKAIAIIGQL